MSDGTSSKHLVGTIALILGVLLCSALVLLYRLDTQPFQDDESLYAEVVHEEFSSHDFLHLTFNQLPYYNKPPIIFWMMDVAHVFTSDDQESTRLPSVLGGVLLVGAVMLCVYEVTKSGIAAAFGGATLIANGSFLILTRAARFDSFVSLWIVLSTYAFLRALDDRRWFLLLGAFMGILIMTKGPVMVVIPSGVIAGTAILCKRFKWLLDPYLWGGVAIALAIALPWHMYETIHYGWAFWQIYLMRQIVQRVQENILGETITNAQYLWYLLKYAAPWSELFVGAACAVRFFWKRMSVHERQMLIASGVGVWAVFIVCFLTSSKAFRYLVPLYPFLSIIIGIVAFEVLRLTKKGVSYWVVLASIVIVLICAIPWALYNGYFLNPSYPYYKNSPSFLAEEKSIGEILRDQKVPLFFVYDTTRVWPVIYYSGLVNPYFMPVMGGYQGADVMVPSEELPTVVHSYPGLEYTLLYKGMYMDLIKASDMKLECFYQSSAFVPPADATA